MIKYARFQADFADMANGYAETWAKKLGGSVFIMAGAPDGMKEGQPNAVMM
jgi:hypothetical protein